MRLFAAVLPPTEVLDELAAEVRELRQLPGADGLRWTERAGWHFTLAFLGDVPDETRPDLRERLARAAHRTAPFRLALRGGGRFGDRALWAGADGELDVMRRLAERAEAAARKAGLAMDGHRRYTPHLTLARSRAAAIDLRPYVAALGAFASEPWTVADLVLVHSRLPRSGVAGERPRYEEVERWPLGGAG
ncbi:RNA 2',3'-cyclic phosphodiesterase [Streptomyces sp. B-S-A8]|uniref:RNA 2',3'-cyclic phosphodiesterase n=1 Tax=Streptomyces solicavernae TaxID=3043614 RepID=A0ABT6RUN2_9ACTN|nr:RNA 2',3'-cyclic phosphodiesterase [Streptomyces sp. B-S-A8]MDI3388145.1 RNA 2',3'-cyclic phosphodiesterase [Streptomyces sp. B-S-A8]